VRRVRTQLAICEQLVSVYNHHASGYEAGSSAWNKRPRSSQVNQLNRPLRWPAPTNKETKPTLCSSSFKIKPKYYILFSDLQLWLTEPYALIPYCNALKISLANPVESLAIHPVEPTCGQLGERPYNTVRVNARKANKFESITIHQVRTWSY
jgi:hypothetical protein